MRADNFRDERIELSHQCASRLIVMLERTVNKRCSPRAGAFCLIGLAAMLSAAGCGSLNKSGSDNSPFAGHWTGNWADTAAAYDRIAVLDPTDLAARMNAGVLRRVRLGDPSAAVADFRAVLAIAAPVRNADLGAAERAPHPDVRLVPVLARDNKQSTDVARGELRSAAAPIVLSVGGVESQAGVTIAVR